MARDNFKSFNNEALGAFTVNKAITPNDGESGELDIVTRALNVETAGNVRCETLHGDIGPVYIAAGIPFPIRVVKVFSTGTTATGIRGLS